MTAIVELLMGRARLRRDQVWFGRGRVIRIEVDADTPPPVQLDGELSGTTPFEARVLPGALNVLVDPDTVPGPGVRRHD